MLKNIPKATIENLIEHALANKIFSTAELLVKHKERIILHNAWNNLDEAFNKQSYLAAEQQPLLFDIASLTKPVFTAHAIMHLVEQGQIDLFDNIEQWFKLKTTATIFKLLTHTAGFPAWIDLYGQTPATAVEVICDTAPQYPSGTQAIYSDLGYILLGEVIKKVTNKSLDGCFTEWISQPLQLENTQFCPDDGSCQIVPTGFSSKRNLNLIGIVNDDNCSVFNGIAGHAGLFSTALDLLKYADFMLTEQPALLSKASFRRLKNDNLAHLQEHFWCIGWMSAAHTAEYHSCGSLLSAKSFGHSSFTGPTLWIDPQTETSIIFLCNRTMYDQPLSALQRFRPRLHNAILSQLDNL